MATAILGAALMLMATPAEPATPEARGAAVTASPTAKPGILWNRESGQVVLANGRLELIVETKSGVNARSLRNLMSGPQQSGDQVTLDLAIPARGHLLLKLHSASKPKGPRATGGTEHDGHAARHMTNRFNRVLEGEVNGHILPERPGVP